MRGIMEIFPHYLGISEAYGGMFYYFRYILLIEVEVFRFIASSPVNHAEVDNFVQFLTVLRIEVGELTR
jgi:hypothetical protein